MTTVTSLRTHPLKVSTRLLYLRYVSLPDGFHYRKPFPGGCHLGDGEFKFRHEHNRRRFVVLSMVLCSPWWFHPPYKLLRSQPFTYKKWLEIYPFLFRIWYRLSTQICSHVCTVTDCLVVQFSILSSSFSITPDMDTIMPNVLTVSHTLIGIIVCQTHPHSACFWQCFVMVIYCKLVLWYPRILTINLA